MTEGTWNEIIKMAYVVLTGNNIWSFKKYVSHMYYEWL